MAAVASIKHYAANDYIYAQGKHTTEVYCLIEGRMRISISSPNGQEFAVVDMDAEAWLGEPGLANDLPRVLDGRLVTKAIVLEIPRKVVLAIGDEYPIMYRNLFLHMMNYTRLLYELIAGILFYPLRSRVAGRLLELLDNHGIESEAGTQLDIKLSQSDFARLALGSRQRVNGIFRDWDKRGLVETCDNYLLVKDRDALEGEISLFE